jgi:uncharacterized membrane protein
MSDLIAIGYDDTTTALDALEAAEELATELVIQPDALAVIIRSESGKFRTITNQHEVRSGTSWGLFWGFLFGVLFFVPVLGMVWGAGLGAVMGKLTKSGIDRTFQAQVRDQLQPGTSALFLIVEETTSEKALEGLSSFGGTVLKTSLSEEDSAELQRALHGDADG